MDRVIKSVSAACLFVMVSVSAAAQSAPAEAELEQVRSALTAEHWPEAAFYGLSGKARPLLLATRAPIESESPRNSGLLRLGGSILGLAGGMIVGGFAGYELLPHTCNCDDPGLDQLVYGALTGGAIGAAFGAAYPKLGSICTTNQRMRRSLAGAGLAAVTGLVLAGDGEFALIISPVASVGGALAALGRCRNTRDTAARLPRGLNTLRHATYSSPSSYLNNRLASVRD